MTRIVGIVIEILDEGDLSLMTGKVKDLQKALSIIENFCASFGYNLNIKKSEMCDFLNKKLPDVPSITLESLLKLSSLLNL